MKGRDSRGRFLPKSHRPRKGAKAKGRRHHATGYTQHRAAPGARPRKLVHVKSYEPRRGRRRGGHRSHASRSGGRRRGGARPVIVVANSPRRRGGHGRRHAMEAPAMSLGGMVVFGLGGILGWQAADIAGRWYEGLNPASYPSSQGGTSTTTTTTTTGTTSPPALPNGITTVQQYNGLVQQVPPTMVRSLIQVAISFVGFVLGGVAAHKRSPIVSLLGYGLGFGALFKVVNDLITGYVIRPMFVTGTGTSATLSGRGSQLYQQEFNAWMAQQTAATQTGGTTLGAPPQARQLDRRGTQIRALPHGQMARGPAIMLAQKPLGAPPGAMVMTPAPTNLPQSQPFPTNPQTLQQTLTGTPAAPQNTPVPTQTPNPIQTQNPTPVQTQPMNPAPGSSSLSTAPVQTVSGPTLPAPAPSSCNVCGDPPDVGTRVHPMFVARLRALTPSQNPLPLRRRAA